jgi:2-polyprenyl-3-methyl-5-hydroxy-6-metoxy-1,4-benzoquinol methylase
VEDPIRQIVASYRDPVIRLYSRLRFIILRTVFLEEIGQYLPRSGRVLDVGCGFGLFSLYYAAREPARQIVGIDRNSERIAHARNSAAQLQLRNVEYRVADARAWEERERFDAIYALDLVHHLPKDEVATFLTELRDALTADGILVLKEVEDRPAWRRWFTLALDRLMVGREPIHYWSPAEMIALLESLGFEVVRHRMRDVLPYPHILYVAQLGDRKRFRARDAAPPAPASGTCSAPR